MVYGIEKLFNVQINYPIMIIGNIQYFLYCVVAASARTVTIRTDHLNVANPKIMPRANWGAVHMQAKYSTPSVSYPEIAYHYKSYQDSKC